MSRSEKTTSRVTPALASTIASSVVAQQTAQPLAQQTAKPQAPASSVQGFASGASTANGSDLPGLLTRQLSVGYGDRSVLDALDVSIHPGSFTVIIGPNACGKSTLLRALARLLSPRGGQVLLDGRDIAHTPAKELARRVGMLPQTSTAPEGIAVVDLVSRGRHPYQGLLRRWSSEDEHAVRSALADTGLTEFASRAVDELSGGQRQRVWIAMALAQQTPVLLLDEPTTYLDIAHQIEVMDLCQAMNRRGRTLVAVLHDLNQAARYATDLIAVRDGRVIAQGHPDQVVTAEVVHTVFGVRARVIEDPESGRPMVIPRYIPAPLMSAVAITDADTNAS